MCKDWQLGKLTNKESLRNLGEMITAEEDDGERDHLIETYEKILDKEFPVLDNDEELNKSWHDENRGD